MKKTLYFALLSSILASVPVLAAVADCSKLSASVSKAVVADQSKVLEIVSSEVAGSPSCACEIVKAAIEGAGSKDSPAKPEVVAAIVQAASLAAPDQSQMIVQCALAVAPDAGNAVQAVMVKLGAANAQNPLDFPGAGSVGPAKGGVGGMSVVPFAPPVIINSPEVTGVDP